MARNANDEPLTTHVADPAACAAMTGTDIDSSAMDDGSGDNVLDVVGDTSTGNQSGPIELNFDKISDEINALNDDCAALKTAIDGLNTSVDAILAALEGAEIVKRS